MTHKSETVSDQFFCLQRRESSFSGVMKMIFSRAPTPGQNDALKNIPLEQELVSIARAQPGATGDVSHLPPTKTQADRSSQPLPITEGSTAQTARATIPPNDVGIAVAKTNSPPSHQLWTPPRRSAASSPRNSALFSDNAKMGNRSTKGSEGADDNASIISVPHVYSGDSAPMNLTTVLDLAESFWATGEFANAHALLEKCLHLMGTVEPPEASEIKLYVLNFETRMRMAVILLYRGKYEEATKGLQDLSNDLDSLPEDGSATASNELKRWVAVSKIYRGNYFKAVEELEALTKGEREQGKVSKIQILRDLALANGLAGRHDDATRCISAAEKLSEPKESTEEDGVRSKWWSIQYTKAYIDTLWGEYETALEKVESAFRGLRDHLGSTHLKTLRSATLGIQLLAKTGRYREAEVQCRKTMQLTNHGLGKMHPLNLETIEGLVYILRSQSRLTEALETVKSLCAMADEALPEKHPQVLRIRSQLAATHLATGNYHTAEKEIRRIVSWAKESLGENHPETLRYQSELAHVLCYYGDFAEARTIAFATLKRQRETYSLLQAEDGSASGTDTPERILDDVLDEIHDHSTVSLNPHPSLVFTLHVIALIEAKDPGGRLDQAERILHSVIYCRRRHLGPRHALTLLSEYELASVIRDTARDTADGRLSYVNNAFFHVWKERSHFFGFDHPETLSAELEVVITDCVRGVWENGGPARRSQDVSVKPIIDSDSTTPDSPPDNDAPPNLPLTIAQWIDVDGVSFTIFTLLESQLGAYHPETLKSLLWLFSIRFLLSKSNPADLKETWRNLRARLHHPSVQGERLVEVLRMEERVALNFADEGDYETGMEILREVYGVVERTTKGVEKAELAGERERDHHLGLLAVLKTIEEDVKREIDGLQPHV